MSKRRNKTNKNLFIILLIVLLLALAVGYAAFSDILTISGTANAKGTFDLEFQNAEVVSAVGADKENTTAQISADKNTLTVKAADLAYPGAGVEYSVDIVNVGSMPAGVKAVTPVGLEGSEHIKIKGLDVIKAGHPTIEAGGKCNIHFTVEWPADSTTALTDGAEDAEFSLQIEYEQATTEMFTGSAKHEDGEGGSTGGEVEQPTLEKVVISGATSVDENSFLAGTGTITFSLPAGARFGYQYNGISQGGNTTCTMNIVVKDDSESELMTDSCQAIRGMVDQLSVDFTNSSYTNNTNSPVSVTLTSDGIGYKILAESGIVFATE